jgi:hypothetical protein
MRLKLSIFLYLLITICIITSCEKELSYETGGVPGVVTGGGSAGGTAKYSFLGGTAACSGAVLSGTFTAGTAATAANTVILKVTVDSIGTYSITSGSVNGVSYSGSGTFTATGTQNITLTASGTPLVAGTFNFTTGPGGCTFSIMVNAATTPGLVNFRAKIDGVQWVANRMAQAARVSGIINITGQGTDKKTITITVPDSGIHQYTLAWDNSSGSAGAFTDSALASVVAFSSNAGNTPAEAGGTLSITSIDEANKLMSGTFSFKAKRAIDNSYRTITEGVFTNVPYTTSLPTGSSKDTLTSKVDGVSFTPTSIFGYYDNMMSKIIITGSNGTGVRSVSLYLPKDIAAGSYTLGGMFSSYSAQYNASSSTFLMSKSGTVEILYHDPLAKRIRGRFNFDAEEFLGGSEAKITEGFFAVTYQ